MFPWGKKKCFEILWENIICVHELLRIQIRPLVMQSSYLCQPHEIKVMYDTGGNILLQKMGQNQIGTKAHMKLGRIGYEPDVADFVNQGIQLLGQVLCIFSLKLSKFCFVLIFCFCSCFVVVVVLRFCKLY